jgi:diguanylate cyclase (GGDEF)-like protein
MRAFRSLYFAICVLVLSTGVGLYVDLKNHALQERHLAISTGLERMLRLNHQLNSMVTLSVLEQNTLRTASYDTVGAELSDTFRTVEKLTQQLNLSAEMSDLRSEYTKLQVVEEQALRLMRQDRWQEARRLLFDDEYLLSKKIYEINSETVVGALTGELAANNARLEHIRSLSLAVWVGAIVLLLWIGTLFSRRLHAEATEQAHLREIISAANRDLEEKVRLRTLELEAANRKLEDLSSTDALTGLANRRRFDAVWELEWQRALRQGFALAVAMIDVDHFKDYNDHYGHQAGDDCLRRLAQVLAAASQRSGELAARYGGEEFVIVLPGVNAEDAMANAERIRSAVQALNIVNAVDIPAGMLTVSIGVACRVPTAHDSPASLLRAADAALYEAKHQGRNRVCFAA